MKNLPLYILMFVFDLLFSTFVVLNLVVFVWRIIWDTQDIYLQSNLYLNSVISVLISFLILIVVKLEQMRSSHQFSLIDDEDECETSTLSNNNNNNTNNSKNNAKKLKIKNTKYSATLKMFILIFSFANINLWRGIWNFTLVYTDNSTMGIIMIGVISIMALIAMNRFCVLVSVPFIYAKDCRDTAYQINPNTNKTHVCLKIEQELKIKPTKWSFLIHFIHEFLADFFTIEAWRSLWSIMDKYMYVEDAIKSAYLSMLIGLITYLILHFFNKKINIFILKKNNVNKCANPALLQRSESTESNSSEMTMSSENKSMMAGPDCLSFNANVNNHISLEVHAHGEGENFEDRLSLVHRLFLYFIFTLGFVGTVSLWRGLWMLQYEYCYPAFFVGESLLKKNVLNLVYMILALIILWSLNLTSSLLSRASCKDDYFIAKKNYIVKHNNFKEFFLKKLRGRKDERWRLKTILHKILRRDKHGDAVIGDFKPENIIYQQKEMAIKLTENLV